MKIDELNQQVTVGYHSARPEKQSEAADTQGEAAAKQPPATDKVELTSYNAAVSGETATREFRAGRVQELKAQIASGTYQVPGRAVAEKMLSKIVMPA